MLRKRPGVLYYGGVIVKILALLVAVCGTAFAQISSIPAASGGGGGGAITAGRVAFGDGTSTPATDSTFLWDNTNKRFQLGTAWVGYDAYIKSSGNWTNTTNYPSYQDIYGQVLTYTYGNGSTGASGADLYSLYVEANVAGNTNTVSEGGGLTAIRTFTTLADTASAAYTTGLSSSVGVGSGATSTTVTGGLFYVSAEAGSTISNAYILGVNSAGSTPTSKWAIAQDSPWPSRFLGKVAIGENNSTAPTATLYVKDATATTGATSVQFDIGAGQSSTSTILTLGGVIRFNGQNTTGAGSAALGSNSPAVTNSAPYTWIRAVSSDGSTVYIPAWK